MIKYLLVLLLCGCSAGAINVSVSGNKLDGSNKNSIDTKITKSTNNSKPVNNYVNTTTTNNHKSTSVNTKLKVSLK